mmetsp:Transcript_60533/g.160393  ORF Transcript_60533/g.160393 Transcript_60533/m.160393 type:complete len:141 (+) Transcript_60533:1-423(+)
MDSFVGGMLGVLTAGRSMLDALRKFADCLDFIQKQVGPDSSKPSSSANEVSFKDVIKAIKTLVDKQMSGTKPAPPPLIGAPPPKPEPIEDSTEHQQPSISGRRIEPAPPQSRYLKKALGSTKGEDGGEQGAAEQGGGGMA